MWLSGWIKDYRREVESNIWLMPPLYHRVWQWLKYNVNHSDNEIPLTDGSTLKIEKGQRLTSIRQIAKGVGWYEGHKWLEPNPKTVKTIINWLKVNRMILVDNGKGNRQYTLVTLTKWDFFQSNEFEGNAEVTVDKQLGNSKETPAGSGTGHKQEGYKKDKNDKNIIPYQEIMNLFNQTCISLPKIKEITKTRESAIKGRWKQLNNSIEECIKFFTTVEESDWLSGRNDKGWKASFDWIFKPTNFTKIMEGNFVNKKLPTNSNTYNFDKAKQDSIVKRQAKVDCPKCNGTGKIKLLDHFTNETIEITCECCKINQ